MLTRILCIFKKYLKNMKAIFVERLNIRILSGVFGYLASAPKGTINENKINPIVIGIDTDTQSKFTLQLQTFIRIDTSFIPELYLLHSEGDVSEDTVNKVLQRSKCEYPNQLAYYIYKPISEAHE